jgi:hypothetical protein
MSRQREADVPKRRRSFGDSRTPDRDRQWAKQTSSIFMLLVWRLASDEECRAETATIFRSEKRAETMTPRPRDLQTDARADSGVACPYWEGYATLQFGGAT